MDNLEKRIKSSKPEAPELSENFSNRVMRGIEGLTILSPAKPLRWIWIIGGAIPLTLAALFGSYSFYETSTNGSVELLYFGTRFLNDVWQYLPLDLILFFSLFATLSSWLFWKSRLLKVGVVGVTAGCWLIAGIGGAALAVSGFNEKAGETLEADRKEWPWLSDFYRRRARYFVSHPHFRMGKIVAKEDGFVWVETPRGEKIKVFPPPTLSGVYHPPPPSGVFTPPPNVDKVNMPGQDGQAALEELRVGQFLRIKGKPKDGVFHAERMHRCEGRRFGRYFRRMGRGHGMRRRMGRGHEMRRGHGIGGRRGMGRRHGIGGRRGGRFHGTRDETPPLMNPSNPL